MRAVSVTAGFMTNMVSRSAVYSVGTGLGRRWCSLLACGQEAHITECGTVAGSVESGQRSFSWSCGWGGRMRMAARWGLVIVISVAAFVAAWWVSQEEVRLDEPDALGVAGAALAIVLTVGAWWVTREQPSGDSPNAEGRRVTQKARAGRDVNQAGRDQTIINYQRRDQ
jgi:hypothetical protein